ncbi:uncharacterized protein LOC111350985 isoform X1 [Spodoptera litura]|uniref:Uncharacterized protein LOC111350985 isoform X1 n=2 Tax=Spodoptera litura TaxID=69820 RepID=A0A9J7DU53_SPOLT|nr:uncharacterized protein LOC111350985 isoform X1 [Spodoptera litura]
MFFRNILNLTIVSMTITICLCYVNYEQFNGFDDIPNVKNISKWQPKIQGIAENTNQLDNSSMSIEFTVKSEIPKKTKFQMKKLVKKCSVNERPTSVGPYVIPTELDLVLFTQRTLLKMFRSYHEKTLLLLKDIKEATRATVAVEKKCHGKGKSVYKECVKQVNRKCVTITKDLVQSLERQQAQVIALTKDTICNMTSMKTDPIQLIKVLAMDEASLEFALPAFLRLLGGCTVYCTKQPPPDRRPRLRKLTDQDLVVRHFLTRKNYVQLLNDTHKYV